MLSSFFHDAQVVPDLLAVCQGEGWISAKVAKKARMLIEHGLHPEQALIGTSLISVDQYGEALTHLFDIPFVRLVETRPRLRPGSLPIEVLKHYQAHVVDQDAKQVLVAFVDPSDTRAVRALTHAAQAQGCELRPAVTLRSDARLIDIKPGPLPSLGRLRRALRDGLEQSATSVLEVGRYGRHWHTYEEGVQPLPSSLWSFPKEAASALVLQLARYAKQDFSGWYLERHPTSEGECIRLTRTGPLPAEAHPLDWSQAFQAFIHANKGVCVLIRLGEEESRRRLQHGWLEKDLSRHWREQPEVAHVYPSETEEEREEVVHAALSGRPVVVTQNHANVAWLEPIASLHIPLYILERHSVPQGMAWTVHLV